MCNISLLYSHQWLYDRRLMRILCLIQVHTMKCNNYIARYHTITMIRAVSWCVSRCPAVLNDELRIQRWVLSKSGSQWTWPTVAPRIPVSSKSRLTICGWNYTCCLLSYNLLPSIKTVLLSQMYLQVLLRWQSCPWIVLTGHLACLAMECWCDKIYS